MGHVCYGRVRMMPAAQDRLQKVMYDVTFQSSETLSTAVTLLAPVAVSLTCHGPKHPTPSSCATASNRYYNVMKIIPVTETKNTEDNEQYMPSLCMANKLLVAEMLD